MTDTDYGSNTGRATFLRFIEEYTDVEQAVAEAVGMRKDLRKRIKGAGYNLAAFDHARREADKSADLREEEDREFRRMMAWLGKPLGTQANLFDDADGQTPGGDDSMAISGRQIEEVFRSGEEAGLNSVHRVNNPWNAGSYLAGRWDEGWLAGQETLREGVGQSDQPRQHRGRGRPLGSRNRPKEADTSH